MDKVNPFFKFDSGLARSVSIKRKLPCLVEKINKGFMANMLIMLERLGRLW